MCQDKILITFNRLNYISFNLRNLHGPVVRCTEWNAVVMYSCLITDVRSKEMSAFGLRVKMSEF